MVMRDFSQGDYIQHCCVSLLQVSVGLHIMTFVSD